MGKTALLKLQHSRKTLMSVPTLQKKIIVPPREEFGEVKARRMCAPRRPAGCA